MSTYKLISWLDKTLFYKNQNIIITAHKQDKQKELFQKVKYAFSQIPDKIKLSDGRIRTKPIPQYDSVNELYFPNNNSRIKVSLDSRSWTPTELHITELAFLPTADTMMTGTLPSVPKNAPITIETTANGIGNYFYNMRQKNYNKNNAPFYCVFIPRYTDPNYAHEYNNIEKEFPELAHLNKLDITELQKSRYYEQYRLLGREVFQEFPSTPEEAFISTGNTVINSNIIKWLKQLEYIEDDIYPELRIYRKAEEDKTYNYWVDTSEWGINWDYSTISVRDDNMNLIASFYWHIPPDELTKVINRLYTLWYKAPWKIGIERNNTGIGTLTKAKDYSWYYDIYSEKTVDKITNKKTKKYWWHTNLKTRPILIWEYEEAIRTWLLEEIDERVRWELYTFVYNERKKAEALQGTHDDWIIADAISIQMIKHKKLIIFK